MGHTYGNLLVHAVFSTKERRPAIDDDLRPRLFAYMGGIARQEIGQAIIIGGTDNHVHSLLIVRADVPVSEAMRKLKGLSSGWVHQTLPERSAFAWQSGYGAFSVSQSRAGEAEEYIRNQAEHHRRQTFEEEFIALLKRHGIEYDPRYVFD